MDTLTVGKKTELMRRVEIMQAERYLCEIDGVTIAQQLAYLRGLEAARSRNPIGPADEGRCEVWEPYANETPAALMHYIRSDTHTVMQELRNLFVEGLLTAEALGV